MREQLVKGEIKKSFKFSITSNMIYSDWLEEGSDGHPWKSKLFLNRSVTEF